MSMRAVLGLAALASAVLQGFLPANHDAARLVGFLLLAFWALAALGVGCRLARALEPEEGGAILLLRASLHAFGFVVVLMTLTGFLGLMRTLPLTVGSAIAFVVAGPPRLAGLTRFEPRALWRAARARPLVALVVALTAALLAVDGAWGALVSANYIDDHSYHLPDVLQWAQDGTFGYWFQCFGNHSAAYYPKATELLFAWTYLPLRELGAAKLVQGPILALSGLTLYALLRELGASRRTGVLATCLVVTRPLMLRLLPSNYVDLMFATLFVASILMLLRLRRAPRAGRAYELCLVVGSFLGTKVLGVLMTALVLVPVGLLVLVPVARQLLGRGGARRGFLAGAAVLFLTGGWWYVRNFAWSGNPLFPLIVEVGGVELFDGAYDRTDLPPSSPVAVWRLFVSELDPGWAKYLPSSAYALVVFGLLAALRRPRRWGISALIGVALPIWIFAVYLRLCPWPYSRFLMATLYFLSVALLPVLDGKRIVARLGELAILASVVLVVFPPVPYMDALLPRTHAAIRWTPTVLTGLAVGIGTASCIAAPVLLRLSRTVERAVLATGAALALALVALVARTSDPGGPHAAQRERELWSPYAFIEEHYGPSRVAFTGSITFLFPYGWKGRNRVRYVQVDDLPDAFHERARLLAGRRAELRGDRTGFGYYRADASSTAWLRNLEEFGAELLVCARMPPWIRAKGEYRVAQGGFPAERAWADADPETFRLVFESSDARVYEVLRP